VREGRPAQQERLAERLQRGTMRTVAELVAEQQFEQRAEQRKVLRPVQHARTRDAGGGMQGALPLVPGMV